MSRKKLRDRLRAGGSNNRRKNLERIPGGFRNEWGVEITEAERRALASKVNSANRKRKKQLEKLQKMPRKAGGQETGGNALQTFLMGKDNDTIIAPKSKSMQRFRSREQFDKYMQMLDRVNDPHYIENRMREYKRNYLRAIQSEHGGAASDIYMKVRMMKPEQFAEMVAQHDELQISFHYSPEEGAAKREQIRMALGMKSKE